MAATSAGTGVAFEVAGIAHRGGEAAQFARAALKCEQANRLYGVLGFRQPGNTHDPNAIAVMGQWIEKGWFGAEKARLAHVGMADLAAAIVEAYGPERNPDLSLYSIYLSDNGYVKIKVIALRP